MAPGGDTGARGGAMARCVAELDRARDLAAAANRPDLVARLDQAHAGLTAQDVTVAVVGEFKQGKSTLVNALLRTQVCPVDDDLVTTVPTVVRYGSPTAVVAHVGAAGGPMSEVPVPFAELAGWVTEAGHDGPPARTVEVRLDRSLLREGLTLIDTPGVGGLDSAQGNATLGALPLVRAALFVTDAAQELTAPELEYLTRTVQRCAVVVCVVTKVDVHGHWRRIVELDRGHLSRAGLDLPVVPVSSLLRLLAAARHSTDLNEESGFPTLIGLLRRDVLAGADAPVIRAVRRDIALALDQLREQVGVAHAVARDPAAGAALAGKLAEKARRTERLAGDSASWQVVLNDGVDDLTRGVQRDLQERLHSMRRRGEALLDAGDPEEITRDIGAWAAREATAVAVDNTFVLVTRAEALAREVAERFDVEYGGLDLDLPDPSASLARIDPLALRSERSDAREVLRVFGATRISMGGGLMTSAALGIFTVTQPWAVPAAAAVAAAGMVLGRKLLRADRQRELTQRRQQAKQDLGRYVGEVAFAIGKDTTDAITLVQRHLRDEFTQRAALAHQSSRTALAAVRDSARLPDEQRGRRVAELDARRHDLDRLAGAVARPAPVGAGGPGGRERT